MSTEKRKYELKARAASQRATRDRIAKAAAELHEEKGVAQTTVAEIARRAGVTRLTVYNHFPALEDLLPACAGHYEASHPAPDFEALMSGSDASDSRRAVLGALYGWYEETEPMFGKLFSDRSTVPELDAFMRGDIDTALDGLADAFTAEYGARGKRRERVRALVRLALDFWTWRRLRTEGLASDAAAELMAGVLEADG